MPPLPDRRRLICGLAALPLAAGAATAAEGGPEPLASLARSAALRGREFGAAVRIDQIEAEPALRETVLRDCGWLTPEIHGKWDQLEPVEGQRRTAPMDGLVDFARRHGLKLRGHTLLWEQSTPDWARLRIGAKDWRPVQTHIEATMQRYGAAVAEWDVVNEPIDADGVKRNLFSAAFGPDYVRRALETAGAALPSARLAINDYGFDYDNPVEAGRRRSFLKLLEALRREGAPLHGVGVQAHLDLSKGALKPELIAPFLQAIADMGLDIAITELDVKESDQRLPLAERDRRVADAVRAYLDIALDQPAVKSVATWGLSDRHSWLNEGARVNRGLPYDAELKPKPMYWALQSSLLA